MSYASYVSCSSDFMTFILNLHSCPPLSLLGGDEVRMQIAVECMRPFSESPTFTVSFTTATKGRHSYALTVSNSIIMYQFFSHSSFSPSVHFSLPWSWSWIVDCGILFVVERLEASYLVFASSWYSHIASHTLLFFIFMLIFIVIFPFLISLHSPLSYLELTFRICAWTFIYLLYYTLFHL